MKSVGLKMETEGLIVAAQDQNQQSWKCKVNIIKNGSNLICWLDGEKTKSIDHLVSDGVILMPKERLVKIEHYIHCKLYRYFLILDFEKLY